MANIINYRIHSVFYKLLHSKGSITSFAHTTPAHPVSAFAGKLFDRRWVRCSIGYLPAVPTSVLPYCYTSG